MPDRVERKNTMEDKNKPASGAALDDGALDEVSGGARQVPIYVPPFEDDPMESFFCPICQKTYSMRKSKMPAFKLAHNDACLRAMGVGGKK